MFDSVKVPKKLANSPINEAICEIRYDGDYPGEALYGILFEVFDQFPDKNMVELPIMQIPKQIRDADPNLHYQVLYRVTNNKYAFSVGPHSIVFSALKPYPGWNAWSQFFDKIIRTISEKRVINKVERIGLRYFNLFDDNIFGNVNAELLLDEEPIKSNPVSFCTEFDKGNIHTILNIGNVALINGNQTRNSLIDIDCIYNLNWDAETFFSSYKNILEETHRMSEKIFFGLLKEELLKSFNPEY